MAAVETRAVPAAVATPAVRDLRGFWRRSGAVVAALAPIALVAQLLLTPSSVDSGFADQVATGLADPGSFQVALWAGLVFSLLMIPAVLAVAWVARRGAPRLALAGGVVSLVAFGAGTTLPNSDLAAYVAGQRSLDVGLATALNDAVTGHPATAAQVMVFVLGQAVGLLLLGLALWRGRAVPAWVGLCVAVSGPAHIGGAALGSGATAAGWALTAVGFVGVSVALLRQPNEAFDHPPLARGAAPVPAALTPAVGGDGDVRRSWQTLLLITAPIAALGITVARYLLPYDTADPPEVIFDKLVAASAFQSASLWVGGALSLVGWVGVLAVAWVTRRRSPLLTTVAVALALPGYLALSAGGPYGDLLTYAVGADASLDRFTALQLGIGMEASVWTIVLGGIFVFGHLVGTVLLGLAALRARALPMLVAVGLAVSQPIHLASVITGIRELDLVGWGLTTIGFAVAGWRAYRLPRDEFDLPPVRS